MQVLELEQENVFPRLPGKLEFESDRPMPKPDVSIFDLINAVNTVLQRFNLRDNSREIYEDKWTVSEKIEHLMRLAGQRPSLKFSDLFEGASSRSEVVCTFLALLELMRLKQLICAQPEAFGEIEISRVGSGSVIPSALASHITGSLALAAGAPEAVPQAGNTPLPD